MNFLNDLNQLSLLEQFFVVAVLSLTMVFTTYLVEKFRFTVKSRLLRGKLRKYNLNDYDVIDAKYGVPTTIKSKNTEEIIFL